MRPVEHLIPFYNEFDKFNNIGEQIFRFLLLYDIQITLKPRFRVKTSIYI